MEKPIWLADEQDWALLDDATALERWQTLYTAFQEESEILRSVKLSDAKSVRVERLRNWWGLVEKVLAAYYLLERGGRRVTPQPLDLINYMRRLAGGLAVGDISTGIADVALAGSPGRGASERDAIAVAVGYILAAKDGQIADKSPIKTIAASYAVDKRTVQTWIKNAGSIEPSRPLPSDPNYIRENLPGHAEYYRNKPRVRSGGAKPKR